MEQTRLALRDMRVQLDAYVEGGDTESVEQPGVIWSVAFNSGYFGVEWKETEGIVLDVFEGSARGWVLAKPDAVE